MQNVFDIEKICISKIKHLTAGSILKVSDEFKILESVKDSFLSVLSHKDVEMTNKIEIKNIKEPIWL